MLLDRNFLIKRYGSKLSEQTFMKLNRLDLITNPNLKEIPTEVLKEVDLEKLNKSLPLGLQSFLCNFFKVDSIDEFNKERLQPKIEEPITEIDSETFRGLSQLNNIKFSYNHIKRLDGNLFEGLNFKVLDLNHCQIVEIDVCAFQGLSSLTKLSLEKNKLTSLDSNLFNGLVNLELLYLHENMISRINSKCFSDLKKIKFISLCQNEVSFKSFACENFMDTYWDAKDFQKNLICSYTFIADFDEFILQFSELNSNENYQKRLNQVADHKIK